MDLRKSREYFNPDNLHDKQIHIIGVGAVGSTVAENLCRHGVEELHIWDFDTVDSKNIANQMFRECDIGKKKTDAVEDQLKTINSDVKIIKHEKYTNEVLKGFIFMCVDSIKIRKDIVNSNLINLNLNLIIDGRMALTDAYSYAATKGNFQYLLTTMDYTDEEARDETPRSACGEPLSLCTTVRILSAVMVSNFIQYMVSNTINKMTIINLLSSVIVEAFPE